MSYRSDALEALDSLSTGEWNWFRPRGKRTRQEFRDLVAEGRVDARTVLHNVATVRAMVQHIDEFHRLDAQLADLRVSRKVAGVGRPQLRVIA